MPSWRSGTESREADARVEVEQHLRRDRGVHRERRHRAHLIAPGDGLALSSQAFDPPDVELDREGRARRRREERREQRPGGVSEIDVARGEVPGAIQATEEHHRIVSLHRAHLGEQAVGAGARPGAAVFRRAAGGALPFGRAPAAPGGPSSSVRSRLVSPKRGIAEPRDAVRARDGVEQNPWDARVDLKPQREPESHPKQRLQPIAPEPGARAVRVGGLRAELDRPRRQHHAALAEQRALQRPRRRLLGVVRRQRRARWLLGGRSALDHEGDLRRPGLLEVVDPKQAAAERRVREHRAAVFDATEHHEVRIAVEDERDDRGGARHEIGERQVAVALCFVAPRMGERLQVEQREPTRGGDLVRRRLREHPSWRRSPR